MTPPVSFCSSKGRRLHWATAAQCVASCLPALVLVLAIHMAAGAIPRINLATDATLDSRGNGGGAPLPLPAPTGTPPVVNPGSPPDPAGSSPAVDLGSAAQDPGSPPIAPDSVSMQPPPPEAPQPPPPALYPPLNQGGGAVIQGTTTSTCPSAPQPAAAEASVGRTLPTDAVLGNFSRLALKSCPTVVQFAVHLAAVRDGTGSGDGSGASSELCATAVIVNNQRTSTQGWQLVWHFVDPSLDISGVEGAVLVPGSGRASPFRLINSYETPSVPGGGGQLDLAMRVSKSGNVSAADSSGRPPTQSLDLAGVFFNGFACSKIPSSSFLLQDCAATTWPAATPTVSAQQGAGDGTSATAASDGLFMNATGPLADAIASGGLKALLENYSTSGGGGQENARIAAGSGKVPSAGLGLLQPGRGTAQQQQPMCASVFCCEDAISQATSSNGSGKQDTAYASWLQALGLSDKYLSPTVQQALETLAKKVLAPDVPPSGASPPSPAPPPADPANGPAETGNTATLGTEPPSPTSATPSPGSVGGLPSAPGPAPANAVTANTTTSILPGGPTAGSDGGQQEVAAAAGSEASSESRSVRPAVIVPAVLGSVLVLTLLIAAALARGRVRSWLSVHCGAKQQLPPTTPTTPGASPAGPAAGGGLGPKTGDGSGMLNSIDPESYRSFPAGVVQVSYELGSTSFEPGEDGYLAPIEMLGETEGTAAAAVAMAAGELHRDGGTGREGADRVSSQWDVVGPLVSCHSVQRPETRVSSRGASGSSMRAAAFAAPLWRTATAPPEAYPSGSLGASSSGRPGQGTSSGSNGHSAAGTAWDIRSAGKPPPPLPPSLRPAQKADGGQVLSSGAAANSARSHSPTIQQQCLAGGGQGSKSSPAGASLAPAIPYVAASLVPSHQQRNFPAASFPSRSLGPAIMEERSQAATPGGLSPQPLSWDAQQRLRTSSATLVRFWSVPGAPPVANAPPKAALKGSRSGNVLTIAEEQKGTSTPVAAGYGLPAGGAPGRRSGTTSSATTTSGAAAIGSRDAGGLSGSSIKSGVRRMGSAKSTISAPDSSTASSSSSSSAAAHNAGAATSSGPLLGGSAGLLADLQPSRDLVMEGKLGSGAFGTVYKARLLGVAAERAAATLSGRSATSPSSGVLQPGPAGFEVAIKVVPFMVDADTYDAKSLQALRQEVQVLSRLRHPHIVQFLGAYLSPPNVCIIEELAVGGSLHTRLHGRDHRGRRLHPPLDLHQVLQMGYDVASAMAHLHPGIVHRDLKPQNVLLDRDGRAKVCDFGLAKIKDRTWLSTKNVHVGTPAFMAPEQFEGHAVNEKVDVYAFAVLMFECISGEQAWADLEHPMQIIFNVGVHCRRPTIPAACPAPLADMIERCWRDDPAARPAFSEVLELMQAMLQQVVLQEEPGHMPPAHPNGFIRGYGSESRSGRFSLDALPGICPVSAVAEVTPEPHQDQSSSISSVGAWQAAAPLAPRPAPSPATKLSESASSVSAWQAVALTPPSPVLAPATAGPSRAILDQVQQPAPARQQLPVHHIVLIPRSASDSNCLTAMRKGDKHQSSLPLPSSTGMVPCSDG